MSKLSVVIPALNEREGIAQVLQRLVATRDALRVAGMTELEVLVVDDGSTDGTGQVVSRLAAQLNDPGAAVRLLRHRETRGYGAALQTGFAKARGSYLAFLDADCTYPPEELPALCRRVRYNAADLVLGDRMSGGPSGMPRMRRLGNALFALLVSLLTGRRVADCCSGMRVLPVTTWHRLKPLPDGLDFTPAMTMRALERHLRLQEVAISYHERVGRSKLRAARDGLRFLRTILREAWRHRRQRLEIALWGSSLPGMIVEGPNGAAGEEEQAP